MEPRLTMDGPRLLIITIGLGQDRRGLLEPVARVVAEASPTRVVFVCTPTSQAHSLEPILAEREAILGEIPHEVALIPDEIRTDLDALVARMTGLIEDCRARFGDHPIQMDFTGGTKPMSAAAVLAAVSCDVPFASYVAPVTSSDDARRVVASGEVHRIGLDRSRFDARFARLVDLFDRGEYLACRLKCKRMHRAADLDGDQRRKLSTLRAMSEAHAAWDRFQWASASETLAGIHDEAIADDGWSADDVARVRHHLDACRNDDGVTLDRAADIVMNASRCLDKGRADDAVARLYRLVEYLLQRRWRLQLSPDHDIDAGNPTSRLTLGILRPLAPRWAAEDRRSERPDDAIVPLGLRSSAMVLDEIGDPFGRWLLDRLGPTDAPNRLGSLLQKRNGSFLAHGSTPIHGKDGQALLAECRQALATCAELEAVDAERLTTAAAPVPTPAPNTPSPNTPEITA